MKNKEEAGGGGERTRRKLKSCKMCRNCDYEMKDGEVVKKNPSVQVNVALSEKYLTKSKCSIL